MVLGQATYGVGNVIGGYDQFACRRMRLIRLGTNSRRWILERTDGRRDHHRSNGYNEPLGE